MSTQSDALASELLRLARKVWPDRDWELWSDGQVHLAHTPHTAAAAVMWPPGVSERERRDLSRRAELSALRVLAGEAEVSLQAASIPASSAPEPENKAHRRKPT